MDAALASDADRNDRALLPTASTVLDAANKGFSPLADCPAQGDVLKSTVPASSTACPSAVPETRQASLPTSLPIRADVNQANVGAATIAGKTLSDLASQLITRSAQVSPPTLRQALNATPSDVLRGLPPLIPLPDGEFDRDHLRWHQKTWYGKLYIVATIPTSRLDDFVRGESRKGLTNFYKQKSEPLKDKKVPPLRTPISSRHTYEHGINGFAHWEYRCH